MIIIQEVIQVYILREVHYGVLLIKDVHDGRMDVQFWVAYMWTSCHPYHTRSSIYTEVGISSYTVIFDAFTLNQNT